MGRRMVKPQELHARLGAGENVLLLDVRRPEECRDWRIHGGEFVNLPFQELVAEGSTLHERLPRDREIVIVCTRGRTAQLAYDALEPHGLQMTVLERGMQGWSAIYVPTTVVDSPRVKIAQLNRIGKGCLSYMVMSQGHALVVDAGRHVEEYVRFAEEEGVQIVGVVDTHLHADHISGGPELAERVGAKYYISSKEMQGAEREHVPLETFNRLKVGSALVRVIPMTTPGHTPGSVSLVVDGRYLLSGDTVFVGGIGRPDLGGKAREWAQALYDTVFRKLATLSPRVLVLPAHYSSREEINASGFVGAMLGDVRRANAVMRARNRQVFTDMVAGAVRSETPPNYRTITDVNRGTAVVDEVEATELETGPNRCAAKHAES